MKKILSITVMLLIVSMAFFSCDTREFDGNPATLKPWGVTGADCGDLLEAIGYYGPVDGVSVSGNTVTFNIDAAGSTDNHGVKVTIPSNYALYAGVEITFKLASVTTLSNKGSSSGGDSGEAGGTAKIGFKSSTGDLTPYDEFELIFGTTAGTTLTQTIPASELPANSFRFNHNKYGGGSVAPINYTLEVTEIKFLIP